MRILLAAAMCIGLTACVTAEPPEPDMTGIDPEHDAHCKSLLMYPGSLVYVQCRLAMSETLREAEDAQRQRLEASLGPLTPEVERAMRDDVFCNFNESSKLSLEPGSAAEMALAANNRCPATRTRFEEVVLRWQPFGAQEALAAYNSDAVATNEATITEARAFR